MKIRNSCLPIIFLGFAIVVFSQSALAQNWVPIIGKERIRDLVSGSRPEILLREGVIATGEYYPDGTALINAWGENFERTWEVVDDETVCYMSVTTTNCYTVEQNSENPAEFRLTHTETRKVIVAIEKRADRSCSSDWANLIQMAVSAPRVQLKSPQSCRTQTPIWA